MLKKQLDTLGFDNIMEINVSDITFEPSLIDLCKQNSCGNYGKNYTCPPLIGETQDLIKKASSFNKAVIFQKVYRIEDSFDIEGMNEGNRNFNILVQKVNEICKSNLPSALVLGAGGCRLCEKCGAADNLPCRFPDKAVAALECYSINVSKLASLCGMKYINGVNTVTYFGGVFY